MSGPSIQIDPERAAVGGASLSLRFEDEAKFLEAFEENLVSGAAFIATRAPFAPRQSVELVFDLAFCGAQVSVPAEIVAVVEPPLAEIADSEPGVSLRFREGGADLKTRLEGATGLDLTRTSAGAGLERRSRDRTRSDSDIRIMTDDDDFAGTTANISYTGVLALLPMTSIPVGTDVRVQLSNPMVELDIPVDGRIVHSRRCDAGMIAHGIQLQYPAERIEEVMAFIEFLQSFDQARRLAVVSGPIESGGLGSVLELFSHTAPAGTLVLTNGDDQGKIVFSENYILRCTAGMVTGIKALARLFLWSGGRFEFHHDIQLAGAPEDPHLLETAMMMASVQVDELHRIGLETFRSDESFSLERIPGANERQKLSDVERETLDYVADGFNVEAISDMIDASDADIRNALVTLIDARTLRRLR